MQTGALVGQHTVGGHQPRECGVLLAGQQIDLVGDHEASLGQLLIKDIHHVIAKGQWLPLQTPQQQSRIGEHREARRR